MNSSSANTITPQDPNGYSRCRWLGPTPEMLIWWIQGPCKPLETFGEAFPLPQTAQAAFQYLRPLQEITEARSQHRIDENLVYLLPNHGEKRETELNLKPGTTRQHTLAFFIDEVTQSFGGIDPVATACRECPLNLGRNFDSNDVNLAGCTGTLILGDLAQLGRQSIRLESEPIPLPVPIWDVKNDFSEIPWLAAFCEWLSAGKDRSINPWYLFVSRSIWASTNDLTFPDSLETLLSESSQASIQIPNELLQFLQALFSIRRNPGFVLHLTHIPRGFSDGLDWWLGPHCFRCHHPMTESQKGCTCCGSESGPVPPEKRRVMGWAPFWPLATLVGENSSQELTAKWLQKNATSSKRPLTENLK